MCLNVFALHRFNIQQHILEFKKRNYFNQGAHTPVSGQAIVEQTNAACSRCGQIFSSAYLCECMFASLWVYIEGVIGNNPWYDSRDVTKTSAFPYILQETIARNEDTAAGRMFSKAWPSSRIAVKAPSALNSSLWRCLLENLDSKQVK